MLKKELNNLSNNQISKQKMLKINNKSNKSKKKVSKKIV